MVAQTAPATRVAIGEEVGLPPGSIATGQMVAGLRALGFDYVFDTGEEWQQGLGSGLARGMARLIWERCHAMGTAACNDARWHGRGTSAAGFLWRLQRRQSGQTVGLGPAPTDSTVCVCWWLCPASISARLTAPVAGCALLLVFCVSRSVC